MTKFSLIKIPQTPFPGGIGVLVSSYVSRHLSELARILRYLKTGTMYRWRFRVKQREEVFGRDLLVAGDFTSSVERYLHDSKGGCLPEG
jgi:hypothetical protein